MAGSSFGQVFRIATWGESHGPEVGVVVEGCPPQVPLTAADIQHDLDRRRPGQSAISTQRQEADQAEICSGVLDGQTLGTPIAIRVRNKDQRSRDYDTMAKAYRPSHADFTYDAKYGIRAWQGGGRASARETVARVAAGAIAKKVLAALGVEIVGYVLQVQTLTGTVDPDTVTQADVEANVVRCPDAQAATAMEEKIREARKAGDSLGGIVGCVARGVPAGWGEPVFDKLDADLAKAMLSIPACRGFDVGSGFAGVTLTGSQHNDPFYADDEGTVRTSSNRSGGVQGGITNGASVVIRAAFKPTATIMQAQDTVDQQGQAVELKGRGRHDPCVLPRAVPIVEAMMALVLVDHALRQQAVRLAS